MYQNYNLGYIFNFMLSLAYEGNRCRMTVYLRMYFAESLFRLVYYTLWPNLFNLKPV